MELDRFVSLIRDHNSAHHHLFTLLEEVATAGQLTAEGYHLFAVNIAVRTMLSLPEIHACCIQASLDLDPLRTTFSVMTGAEEGGAGKPEQVHTVLMMKALNTHGSIVFNLPPLHLPYFMSLIRLLHATGKYKQYLRLQQKHAQITDEELSCFVNKVELTDICRRCSAITGIKMPESAFHNIAELELIEELTQQELLSAGVVQETIDYCLAQLNVFTNMTTGYLQGVGFAHEGLADGMINKMFRIMYSQIDSYQSTSYFMQEVYPYFAAHGNYLQLYTGLEDDAEGVEVTHAQRELAKLSQLDDEALQVAWQGANDFANRNALIWDGMLKAIDSKTKAIIEY